MRAIFGLVGVLVVLGVIVMIMSSQLTHTQQVLKTGRTATEEVSQIAGVDTSSADGTHKPASSSIETQIVTSNNKLAGILVTKVTPGGVFEKYFGLQKGDTIVAIEYQGSRQAIRDFNDEELAKAQLTDTYQRKGFLYVKRTGHTDEVKLPQAPVVVTPTPIAAPAAPSETGQPAPPPAGGRNSLQRQLDAISAPR